MTIDSWISEAAEWDPGKTALDFEGQQISYAEMAAEIDRRAGQLTAQGVAHGDRVAWYGLNHPEVFILLFACARIGAILVPLNWRLAEAEIAEITANCAPKLILHDHNFANAARALSGPRVVALRELPADTATLAETATTDDPLLLVYTSGSTGRPKGVILRQKALICNAKMSIHAHGLAPEDRVLNVLPLFHVGGLNIRPTPAFSIGATVVLHASFDPDAMCADLARVNHAISVPTVLQAVINRAGWAGADLSNLRGISIGSTDVPVALIEAVHARGVPVFQVYGATETSPFAIYQTVETAMSSVGSLGQAGCACQIRLVDGHGADVPDDVPGEIWVGGDNVLAEYWRDPELTAETLRDGWFATGDVASRDANGFYWFADRIKHVIISGGENIYPAEIERILRLHPDVAEVAVVGRSDARWGEVPVAVVVGNADRGDDILAALDGQIARYKRPKEIRFVDALPRNAMGKVVAAEVRKLL